MPRRAVAIVLWLGSFASLVSVLNADDALSLHQRIDSHIEGKAQGPLAPRSDDSEFVRRVYLDLAGRIPSADEARAFLASTEPAKRTQLVDQLLSSEDHRARMQQWLHVTLMERLGEHDEWSKYLKSSVAANKHWDQYARELLNPTADDEATRGSALFFSKRLENYGQNPVDVPALVRDVGRLFMGIDVQCAQCHDHLFVDDYKQEYYQGLFAFVGQLTLRSDLPYPAVVEKPLAKKVDFVSVFVQQPKTTGPRLPGRDEIEIPVFATGEEFETPPDPATKKPGKLKFSALRILSQQLPTADNQLFTRNIVNRLWCMMMGRGLIDPLDLQHAGNLGSHLEVLDLLAGEFARHQFDMPWLLRELALTETYQRSGRFAEEAAIEVIPTESYRIAIEKPLLAEQLLTSMLQATGQPMPDDKAQGELQKKFAAAFANPPREPEIDHHPALRGALFLMNDAVVLGWLQPANGNLLDRLNKISEPAIVSDELYLSVLSRTATEAEKAEVATYLAARSDNRTTALAQLAWALLSSNEFYVNH
jgi:hypothetical protein